VEFLLGYRFYEPVMFLFELGCGRWPSGRYIF